MAILPQFAPNTTGDVWYAQPTPPNVSGLDPNVIGTPVQQLQTYIAYDLDQRVTYAWTDGPGFFLYRAYLSRLLDLTPAAGTPVLRDYVAIPDKDGWLFAILGVDRRFNGQELLLYYCSLSYQGKMP